MFVSCCNKVFAIKPPSKAPLNLLRALRGLVTWTPLASDFNSQPKKFNLNLMRENVGLFGISDLQNYNGFFNLKDQVENDVNTLVQEAVSVERGRKMVEIFDDLSNTLCKIADMADFIQVAHPDDRYRQNAHQICIDLNRLVEKLNTNYDLYRALYRTVHEGDVVHNDEVDDRVAELFLIDFEQSGIHLSREKRQSFVSLNESVLTLGASFLKACHSPAIVPVKSLPDDMLQYFSVDDGFATIYTQYSDHPSSMLRETIYKLHYGNDPSTANILESLLQRRSQLAQLVGFPTFSHRALCGTLGKTPEKVSEFLEALSSEIAPMAAKDFKNLLEVKKRKESCDHVTLGPWDIPYLSAIGLEERYEVSVTEIMPYLSLGCCMEGLHKLFQSLYGISLQRLEPEEGEVWHNSVYKLAVIEDSNVLGYIFCDFFERKEKPHQDCHFTIRGGKELSNGEYQLPIVVLFLNFPQPRWNVPCLLTPSMLENLFHEFGHAMHSILGSTKYQHVTGTRCSTDFAEIPSNLMEYFVHSAEVVSSFARHFKTGESIPTTMLNRICYSKSLFSASEMQLQLFYSLLDQRYHGLNPTSPSSTEILRHMQNSYYGIPYVNGTAKQLRFSHLVTYGSKYYSYIMAKAVAACIWQKFFQDNPFNSQNGRRLRYTFLKHGGEHPPAKLIEDMLGEELTIDKLVASIIEDIR